MQLEVFFFLWDLEQCLLMKLEIETTMLTHAERLLEIDMKICLHLNEMEQKNVTGKPLNACSQLQMSYVFCFVCFILEFKDFCEIKRYQTILHS